MNNQQVKQDQSQTQYASNFNEMNEPSIVKLRLSTDLDIYKFECFLRGKEVREVTDPDDVSKTQLVTFDKGEPLANDHGVNQIISLFSKVANPNVVQGNFWEETQYYNYVYMVEVNVLCDLVNKAPHWGIRTNDVKVIHDMFLLYIVPYMTRAYKNLERESLTGGMRPVGHIEGGNTQVQGSTGRKGWFGS